MKKIISFLLVIIILSCGLYVSAEDTSVIEIFYPIDYKVYSLKGFDPLKTISGRAFSENTELESKDIEDVYNLLKVIYNGILNMEETINVSVFEIPSDIDNTNFLKYYVYYVYNSNPEFFMGYTDFQIKRDGDIISSINFKYSMNKSDYDEQLKTYKKCLDDIVDKMPRNMSDVGKVLYIYDYLVLNYSYDFDDMYNDIYQTKAAYTMLTEKKGVCRGFSEVFSALMKELGIYNTEAILMINDSNNDGLDDDTNEVGHMWNIVELDGHMYNVDVTWGNSYSNISRNVNHDFFLLSDSTILKTNNHSHYFTNEIFMGNEVSCNDRTYDGDTEYAWKNSNSVFCCYNNEYYYIDNKTNYLQSEITSQINKTTDFINYEKVTDISSPYYYVYDDEGVYTNSYSYYPFSSGLSNIGSQLYYNTCNSIEYYDLKTKETSIVKSFGKDFQLFSSSYTKNGIFNYSKNYLILNPKNTSSVIYKSNSEHCEYSVGLIGDIDENEKVNSKDLIFMQNYLLNNSNVDICNAKIDVDNDSIISVKDLVEMKKKCCSLN